jgi:hypothetical protein
VVKPMFCGRRWHKYGAIIGKSRRLMGYNGII